MKVMLPNDPCGAPLTRYSILTKPMSVRSAVTRICKSRSIRDVSGAVLGHSNYAAAKRGEITVHDASAAAAAAGRWAVLESRNKVVIQRGNFWNSLPVPLRSSAEYMYSSSILRSGKVDNTSKHIAGSYCEKLQQDVEEGQKLLSVPLSKKLHGVNFCIWVLDRLGDGVRFGLVSEHTPQGMCDSKRDLRSTSRRRHVRLQDLEQGDDFVGVFGSGQDLPFIFLHFLHGVNIGRALLLRTFGTLCLGRSLRHLAPTQRARRPFVAANKTFLPHVFCRENSLQRKEKVAVSKHSTTRHPCTLHLQAFLG